MNDINPYSAPQSDVSTPLIESEKFPELDFKQLKKLYYRSCNVNAIVFLLGIGTIFLAITVAFLIPDIGLFPRVAFGGLAVFYTVAVIGIFKRTSWGRVLGIIVCIFSLLSVPFGTLIGAIGLFAFFGAPQLFGSDRITHKELKAEFKRQKAHFKKA